MDEEDGMDLGMAGECIDQRTVGLGLDYCRAYLARGGPMERGRVLCADVLLPMQYHRVNPNLQRASAAGVAVKREYALKGIGRVTGRRQGG